MCSIAHVCEDTVVCSYGLDLCEDTVACSIYPIGVDTVLCDLLMILSCVRTLFRVVLIQYAWTLSCDLLILCEETVACFLLHAWLTPEHYSELYLILLATSMYTDCHAQCRGGECLGGNQWSSQLVRIFKLVVMV